MEVRPVGYCNKDPDVPFQYFQRVASENAGIHSAFSLAVALPQSPLITPRSGVAGRNAWAVLLAMYPGYATLGR